MPLPTDDFYSNGPVDPVGKTEQEILEESMYYRLKIVNV